MTLLDSLKCDVRLFSQPVPERDADAPLDAGEGAVIRAVVTRREVLRGLTYGEKPLETARLLYDGASQLSVGQRAVLPEGGAAYRLAAVHRYETFQVAELERQSS